MKNYLAVWVTALCLCNVVMASAQIPRMTGPTSILQEQSAANGLTRLDLAYDPVNRVYLVVWAKMGDGAPVRGQLLDAAGSPLGSRFFISEHNEPAGFPKVAFGTHEGRFLVAYTKPGAPIRRMARFVQYSDGQVSLPEGEFQVAAWSGHAGSEGDVKYSPVTRKFFVGWWRWQLGTLPNSHVTVIDGLTRQIDGTHLISAPEDGESDPNIACDTTGDRCLVVGYSWGTIPGNVTNTPSTWGRFISASTGAPIGSVFFVATDPAAHTEQAITFSPQSNRFIVSFTRQLQHVYSVTVDALTGAVGARKLVKSPTNHSPESDHGGGFGSSRLAVNPANGEVFMSLMTWNGWTSLQVLDANGATIASRFAQVPSAQPNYELRSKWSEIAFAGASCEVMVADIQAFVFGRSAKYQACEAAEAAAEMTSPASASMLPGASATFEWSAGTGAQEYLLDVGTSRPGASDLYSSSQGQGRSRTVSGLPTQGGTIYVRLWTRLAGGWQSKDYTYVAHSQVAATMTSPAAGAQLTATSANFQWTAGSGALEYFLSIGTSRPGSQDLYYGSQALGLSRSVTGLPTHGGPVYVRLWTRFQAGWEHADYLYIGMNAVPAALVSPAEAALSSTSATFLWTAGAGALEYWLSIGTSRPGSDNIYSASQGLALTRTWHGLPSTGGSVYVRLWTRFETGWQLRDYTYLAVNFSPAVLLTPVDGSVVAGTATLEWDSPAGALEYWLDVGTSRPGSTDSYSASQGLSRMRLASGLPPYGGTVYVRLWTRFPGGWQFRDYQFLLASPASMISPVSGTVLGTSATFQWSSGTGALEYWLSVGASRAGSQELYYASQGTAQARTLTGLPAQGGTIYVRLWTRTAAGWDFVDFVYLASGG